MAYAPRADRRRSSSAELEDERRALEVAGREEWERATREGRDVQARTTDELRALGARVLARKATAGSASRGERVVVTAEDAPVERSRYATNVEFEPSLQDRINASAGKRIYATLEAD